MLDRASHKSRDAVRRREMTRVFRQRKSRSVPRLSNDSERDQLFSGERILRRFIHSLLFVIKINFFVWIYVLTSFCKYDTLLKMKSHIFKDAEQRRKIPIMFKLRKSQSVSRVSNDGDWDELLLGKRIFFYIKVFRFPVVILFEILQILLIIIGVTLSQQKGLMFLPRILLYYNNPFFELFRVLFWKTYVQQVFWTH